MRYQLDLPKIKSGLPTGSPLRLFKLNQSVFHSHAIPKSDKNASKSEVPTAPSWFKSPGQSLPCSMMHDPSSVFAEAL
jgi:hypothetical protein